MKDYVEIQVKQASGNWVTAYIVLNNDPIIENGIRNAQQAYPGYRIRVIDDEGRLVDIVN